MQGECHVKMKIEVYKPRDCKDCQKPPEEQNRFFPQPSKGGNPAQFNQPIES